MSPRDIFNVGRIIRACADLEDIVSRYLCNLSGLTNAQLVILLGKSPVSSKVAAAEVLAKTLGGDAITRHQLAFGDLYRSVMKCRNTVAHGRLLGLTAEGELAFSVVETLGFEGTEMIGAVNAYSPDELRKVADIAEALRPEIIRVLGLPTSPDKPTPLSLIPHPKARQKERPASTPPPPPQPSSAKRERGE